MHKRNLIHINLIICFIIMVGFFSIAFTSFNSYEKILEDDIENISRLTSSTIYAEINNELTKPIFVSQTMANDTFLKTWMLGETEHADDADYSQKLKDYLYALKVKYNYDSVFLVSSQTNIYYYFKGVNKVVSRSNQHDVWYYDFLDSGKLYDLDVDVDEVNHNELTVFVNCRIEDPDGALMGVVGVGVKMSQLQSLLKLYESDFDLQTFLIDPQGLVQAHTDTDMINNANLFSDQLILPYQANILSNRDSMEIQWYSKKDLSNCLITRYIDNLDWYLVVEKNTEPIRRSFHMQLKNDSIIVLGILFMLLALSTNVIKRYDKKMVKMATTDGLTGLLNHKSFEDLFDQCIVKNKQKDSVLFIFDIDHFKSINDTKGHLFGDTVLSQVGSIAKEVIGDHGFVARWGGDEFVGLLFGSEADGKSLLNQLTRQVKTIDAGEARVITISIGAAQLQAEESLDGVLDHADKALYSAKAAGRDQIAYYQELQKA